MSSFLSVYGQWETGESSPFMDLSASIWKRTFFGDHARGGESKCSISMSRPGWWLYGELLRLFSNLLELRWGTEKAECPLLRALGKAPPDRINCCLLIFLSYLHKNTNKNSIFFCIFKNNNNKKPLQLELSNFIINRIMSSISLRLILSH